jgi:diadenosine tetraphosphate (Ap4A) HIT family hydrolase
MSDDWRTDRIGSAQRGENPTVLRRLDAGFAVIGDTQFLPGYCVLLVDEVGVERLSDLPRSKRMAFLSDMDRLGEAVERACRQSDAAFRRVNPAHDTTSSGRPSESHSINCLVSGA